MKANFLGDYHLFKVTDLEDQVVSPANKEEWLRLSQQMKYRFQRFLKAAY